ncbi:hypothetical protein A3N60_22890 [Klebsiella aerogenes]|nr:hypothetical protein A3N60_22890 [Klebsiella aerogenes]
MSSMRLMIIGSLVGTRTTGALWLPFNAISCGISVVTSFGACSASSTSQSKPASPNTSVLIGFARAHQQPICTWWAASAALNLFGKIALSMILPWVNRCLLLLFYTFNLANHKYNLQN